MMQGRWTCGISVQEEEHAKATRTLKQIKTLPQTTKPKHPPPSLPKHKVMLFMPKGDKNFGCDFYVL
jgi:hypothetical protein